jgi:hypothetical protein
VDRRGLTGSTRLLADIDNLDQYAFQSNKRRLQLTKTFALSQLNPVEFEQFRETGLLRFTIPLDLFDRDFPGHYHRVIRDVRTSVVALIPPNEGIHATLRSSGVSRVIVGQDTFQQLFMRRDAEEVALTSPVNATGLFELTPTSDMLLPFEGSGVDMRWEFTMPKGANLFDYQTIADVLITINYTALDSAAYRDQVIRKLSARRTAYSRSISFRQQLPDQWYDLHNPDQTAHPFVVTFETAQEDFAPNLSDLKLMDLVLFIARSNVTLFETKVALSFQSTGAAAAITASATTTEGVINTRKGSAASWAVFKGRKPLGQWTLDLSQDPTIRKHLEADDVEDILFVMSYTGQTATWLN